MARSSMLQNPFSLPASTGRLIYPVAAVLLAGLTATTLVAALGYPPRGHDEVVLMTSGGKFAARIPDVLPPAGPALTQPGSGRPAAGLPVLLHPAEAIASDPWTGALSALSWTDAAAPKPRIAAERQKVRAEARRVADALPSPRPAVSGDIDIKAEDGTMPQLLSSARTLLSLTASTGGSLLSRLLPQ